MSEREADPFAEFGFDDAKKKRRKLASKSGECSQTFLLDETQQNFVNNVLENRKNTFLTGAAGVGKSYCIGALVHAAVEKKWKVALTATTGLAAQNLASLVEQDNVVPSTVHRFAGLVPNEYDVKALVRRVRNNSFLLTRFKEVTLWIIDEVSMLSPTLFVLLDRIARLVREEPNKPFGGIVMVFVGDFFQLPPVVINSEEIDFAKQLALQRKKFLAAQNSDNEVADSEAESKQSHVERLKTFWNVGRSTEKSFGASIDDLDNIAPLEYCFETLEWRRSVDSVVLLTKIYRQTGDKHFIDILNQVRHAKLSPEASQTLQNRTFAVLYDRLVALAGLRASDQPDIDTVALTEKLRSTGQAIPRSLMPLIGDVEPTKLMSRNALVDAENDERLAELDGPSIYYHAQSACNGSGIRNAGQRNALCGQMERDVRAPKTLQLRIGAQVMLVANLTNSLVNGSRGVVIDFREMKIESFEEVDEKQAEKERQSALARMRADWGRVADCASDEPMRWPVVLFDNGIEMLMTPHVWTRKSKRPKWTATLTQVPLQLAWAISIHKSQGMSISMLTVDLQQLFASGQAYVALSRARSLDGLMLESFQESMCTNSSQAPNPKVLRYYNAIEKMQLEQN